MASARYVSPQIASVISKLVSLGNSYLLLHKNMNFFERTFGLYKNHEGAKTLTKLNIDIVMATSLEPFELDMLDRITNSCSLTGKDWKNPHLPEDFESGLKILHYLKDLVKSSTAGSLFLPKILNILKDAKFSKRVNSPLFNDQPADVANYIDSIRGDFRSEKIHALTEEVDRFALISSGYIKGYREGRKTAYSEMIQTNEQETNDVRFHY